jgi:diguanylate cyclase (GGDEF)-like protein/PAS domain S-box-containing protein
MADADWFARVVDSRRVQVLRRTDLLDSAAEEGFDRLTRLSSELLGAPIALVSLVDERRQFFKSSRGLGQPWATLRETPLSHSFCKHVVASREMLVVPDARDVPMLRDNPAVSELGVIAYAGAPIQAEGETIGAFCAIDNKPRAWSDEQVRLLRELASLVETQIDLKLAQTEAVARGKLLDVVLDTMPTGLLIREPEGAVVRTNPALERMLGRTEAELATTDFWEITHPDDLPGDQQAREQLLRHERSKITRIKRYRHADGHYVWVRLSAAVLRDARQVTRGTVAMIEDVTAERQAEAEIVRQVRLYQTIARSIPRGAVLMFDRDLRYQAADGAELLDSIGIHKDALEGKTLQEVADPELLAPIEFVYRRALAGHSGEIDSDFAGRSLLTRVAPIWDGDAVIGGIALVQDVTEERDRAAALRRANALFQATIDSIRDGVIVLDPGQRVRLANRAAAELLNYEHGEMANATRDSFLAHLKAQVEDPEDVARRLALLSAGTSDVSPDFVLIRPRRRTLRRFGTPIELPEGSGMLVVWHDISAELDLLAERERQALTDALTGIANRRNAEQVLAKELARAERSKSAVSVALLDIDHFKSVNDRFGHGVGDEVLRRVAATLESARRITDSVARWGGEEFLAILPVPLDGAVAFCERARKAIAASDHPGVGRVTVSAGVAEYRPGESRDEMLSRADQRLYLAKSNGRNRVES